MDGAGRLLAGPPRQLPPLAPDARSPGRWSTAEMDDPRRLLPGDAAGHGRRSEPVQRRPCGPGDVGRQTPRNGGAAGDPPHRARLLTATATAQTTTPADSRIEPSVWYLVHA